MQSGLGVWGLVAILVVAAAAAVCAVLYFRFGVLRRRRRSATGKAGLLNEGRIEVLERTKVDADRQLLLVRCDRVEHLILVGGPADVVVENDVKKLRGPGVPAPTAAIPEPAQQAANTPLEPATLAASRAPAADRTSSAARTGALDSSRPGPASISGATNRTALPPLAPAAPLGDAREQRQRPGDTQFGRGGGPQRRTIQPTPLGGDRPEPARAEIGRERRTAGRSNGRQNVEPPTLPVAGLPWAESDSIESEIVQALRVDPVPRGGGSAAKPQPPIVPKSKTDPSTTLGDLADRLEEALAEEVQSASHGRRKPEPEADEFTFDSPASENAAPRITPEEKRSRKKEKTPPPAPAAKTPPEPERERERRREAPATEERREEAPVISLNARRREAADPLEDEMARLLGELTGDTKGR